MSDLGNTVAGGALGTGVGTLLSGGAPGIMAIGGLLGGTIGGKLFGHKKKGPDPYQVMAAASANKYNSDVSNASKTLQNDYTLGSTDNQDLLDSYLQSLSDQYNDNKLSYYNKNSYDTFKDNLTNKNKAQLQGKFNNLFGGFGTTNAYLDNIWNNNSDQQFVNDYLQGYYDDAMGRLDTAKSRGLLNESGYNNALNELNRRNSAAYGQVNELTDNVINNYRDDWSNLGSNLQSAIDNYTLANRFDNTANTFQNQFDQLYGQQQQDFEGNLNNAVSGYTPYDVSDLLASARGSQGVLNSGAQNSELLDSLKERENKTQNKIGLGNQGIF